MLLANKKACIPGSPTSLPQSSRLLRFVIDPMATELAAAEPAAGPAVPKMATDAGGGASPPHPSKRRGRGGVGGATAAAIKSASSTPPCKTTKLPPGHGAAPAPEETDGLDDDDELHFEPYVDDEEDGEDGQPHPYGTAEVLQCLYANLYGNVKPTKAQMTAEGERERTSLEMEADAQRV